MIVAGPDFRPPPQLGVLQFVFIVLAIQALQTYDMMFGPATITLTSWFRDPMRNAQVGGVPNSLHQVGLALDFTVRRDALPAIACGLGSVFGLCKEPGPFTLSNLWRQLAPPFTQTQNEPNGSSHWELDLK